MLVWRGNCRPVFFVLLALATLAGVDQREAFIEIVVDLSHSTSEVTRDEVAY